MSDYSAMPLAGGKSHLTGPVDHSGTQYCLCFSSYSPPPHVSAGILVSSLRREGDFVWSDAWLLLSLIYGKGALDRQRIRDIGDFINHAVFTDAELEGGLKRLQNCGLIRRAGKKFAASSGVMNWYAKEIKGKSRTYVFKDFERVSKRISACRKPGPNWRGPVTWHGDRSRRVERVITIQPDT